MPGRQLFLRGNNLRQQKKKRGGLSHRALLLQFALS
jgi:hypothetical protein